MKISAKLIVSFLVVALLALIVGVIGITQLMSVNSQYIELYDNSGDSQGYIGYINSDFLEWNIDLCDMILDKDVESSKALVEQIRDSEADMAIYLAKFKETCVLEEEKQNYSDLVAAIDQYKTSRDKAIELCLAGRYDDAYSLVRGEESSKAFAAAEKIINDTVANNIQAGADESDALSKTVNSTMWLLIAIAAAAVIGAVTLGVLISRSISKPIQAVVGAADKLAAGDTDIQLNIKNKDETAMLAKAMESVIASLKRLISDANMLAQAAMEGRLSARADASAHEGDYRRIVDGINHTLDAVITPVNEASAVLSEVSRGNLGVLMTGDYKGDHAAIKLALNNTINAWKGYIDEITRILSEVATGDLDTEITSEYQGDFVAIKDSINNIVESLNNVMGEINSSAEQVAAGTQQVSAGSQALSQGATEQASAIEQLTSSVTEIANQTRQNALNANQANELSIAAKDFAAEGNERMKDMRQAMDEINESSASISQIIKVIDEIAFQTNLLALNAAVEAARAGQHGKGFAVVAEEVRNLAQRSANAAKETTGLIEESIKKVKAGTQMAADTAQALEKIVDGVEKATGLMGGIAKASNDQATAVTQINSGIEQVSQVVQTNSATAEESAAASEELSGQADALKTMVGRFNLKNRAVPAAHKANPPKKAAAHEIKAGGGGAQAIVLNDRDFGKY